MPTHNLQQIMFTREDGSDVLVDVFTRTDDSGRTEITSAQMSERPAARAPLGNRQTWGQMTEGVLLPNR